MDIVTVNQMQAIEKSANAGGLSYDQMMQNAGVGIAKWVKENLSLQNGVVGLVGAGKNGGDTLIALKSLSIHGIRTIAFLVKARGDDPLITAYLDAGGQVVDISRNTNLDILRAALLPGTILLDGILGTGLRLPLRGILRDVMAGIQDTVKNRPGGCVIAVDCPSGMDCDTGEVSPVTLPAMHTLCMAAIKQGLLKHPGRSTAGQLHIIQIGIGNIRDHLAERLPEMLEADHVHQLRPRRPSSGHKGTFGTCQIIAGTAAYTGAAYLAGKAAYRVGCGLVDVATQDVVQRCLAGQLVESVWTILPESAGGYDHGGASIIVDHLKKADALVVGPGLGLAAPTRVFMQRLVEKLPHELPVVFDADGLKLLGSRKDWYERLPEQVIITPHPGEMAVLCGQPVDEIQADRWGTASRYAQLWGVVLILKGAETVIALPDGGVLVNPVSDASLATAGSGDVLAGMIGGLLAQGLSPQAASVVGVWQHAQAGLLAKTALGSDASVTACDLLDYIHETFLI